MGVLIVETGFKSKLQNQKIFIYSTDLGYK